MSDAIHPDDFGTPFAALVQHFESNNIRFNSDRSGKWIQFHITGECASFNCRLQISPNDQVLHLCINLPVTSRDRKLRPLVTETLVRINHNLVLGAFDNDLDSGQIGFYAGQVIPADGLDDRIIGGLFTTCMTTCDRYFPALMRVMFGGTTPADAVYLSEIDVHSETVEASETKSLSRSDLPKPTAKKPRASRKSPRSKQTKDLPGLFEKGSDEDSGEPHRK